MRAEIIFIGTELLLGQIMNSNAVFLGAELMSLGIDCYFQTVVGDNKDRIKQAFETALTRSDLIITTGGLGPTSDDLTTECLAEFFGEELVLDQAILEHIQNLFVKYNKKMAESNKKQALRPKTADVLFNSAGTAPGIIWQKSFQEKQKIILTFPGVPREVKTMWNEIAKPFLIDLLHKQSPDLERLYFKELKFYGIGESDLAEKVQDLLDKNDPTTAPLAGQDECRLRIATKAINQEIANQKIKEIELIINQRVGQFIYGINDESLESVVINKLKDKKQTISLAESCTGGLISKRLTDIAGSSACIGLNVITYSNESKINLLKVKPETLSSSGAVSEQTVLEMATGIINLAKTDWALAVSGIAGPSGEPIGKVFLALIKSDNSFREVKTLDLGLRSREEIRWKTSQEALAWILKTI
jgi:nicotinamide-nucleotide amidase